MGLLNAALAPLPLPYVLKGSPQPYGQRPNFHLHYVRLLPATLASYFLNFQTLMVDLNSLNVSVPGPLHILV